MRVDLSSWISLRHATRSRVQGLSLTHWADLACMLRLRLRSSVDSLPLFFVSDDV